MRAEDLCLEEVRRVFAYESSSGRLFWIEPPCNAVAAGDEAGSADKNGHRQVGWHANVFRTHRLIWFWVTGKWPAHQVDHINGKPGDNRWSNLRDVTGKLNCQNRRGRPAGYSDLPLGVTPVGRRFQAQIRVAGRSRYLGLHATPEAAHDAYVKAKREMHPGNTL